MLPKEQARLRAKALKQVGQAIKRLCNAERAIMHNRISQARSNFVAELWLMEGAEEALREWKRIR